MLRSFDPQTGRFLQHDPYDQFASGYVGMGNDPANGVDPSGGFWGGLHPMIGNALQKFGGTFNNVTVIGQAKKNLNTAIKIGKVAFGGLKTSYNVHLGFIQLRGQNDAINNANSLGVYDNFFGGNHLYEYDTSDEQAAYLRGRLAGDAISVATGLGQVKVGGMVVAAGRATGIGALVISTSVLL